MWDYNIMRPEKGQERKGNSRLCGILLVKVCLLWYSCLEWSHSFQMQAAVRSLLLEKRRFRVHVDPLVLYYWCLRWHLTERWPPVTDEVVKMGTCLLPLTYLCWQPLEQPVAPLFLIRLSPMVMSAGRSKSNIHAQADSLGLFVWKNRPCIALAAASSRYGGRTVCFKFLSDRIRATNKAATYLPSIHACLFQQT